MIQTSQNLAKWIGPGVIGTAWALRISLFSQPERVVESILGMFSLIVLLYIYLKRGAFHSFVWENDRKLVGILRPWNVEVYGACLFSSVPLGIDLSHSAKRVLEVMSQRFHDVPGGYIMFFVVRPLGNAATITGMMVKRKASRIRGATHAIESIADKVQEDTLVLESALRSVYPHTPISRAGLNDTLLVLKGGVATNVECD